MDKTNTPPPRHAHLTKPFEQAAQGGQPGSDPALVLAALVGVAEAALRARQALRRPADLQRATAALDALDAAYGALWPSPPAAPSENQNAATNKGGGAWCPG
jgi:hypothetical protein